MINNQENFETNSEVEIINDDFSPLDAPVKKRSYTQHKMDDVNAIGDLEEPTFERPSFADLDEEENSSEPERPFNPSYSELDGKEKTMGAEMMADMTLDIYEKGCFYMGKIPEISESKIDRLVAEGEIDPDIRLETQAGAIPIKDFALEFNDSIKDAFSVSDEFKEKVRPPLVRVFKKRAIGMTDEQLLAYYFATDLGAKGVQAFMLRKTANGILDALKENTQAVRENANRNQSPAPTPMPQQQYEERPTVQPIYKEQSREREVDYSDNISEVVKKSTKQEEVQKPKRRKPKTNLEEQLAYFEPEEQAVFDNLKDKDGFVDSFQDVAGMPKFGDASILSELEKLSKKDPTKPIRKVRTTALSKPRRNKKE